MFTCAFIISATSLSRLACTSFRSVNPGVMWWEMKLGGGLRKEVVSAQVPWPWVRSGLSMFLQLPQTHSLGDAVFTPWLSEVSGSPFPCYKSCYPKPYCHWKVCINVDISAENNKSVLPERLLTASNTTSQLLFTLICPLWHFPAEQMTLAAT